MQADYYNTKETVKEYIQLAKDVNGKSIIQALENHLSKNSTILEIGSGPGSDWNILNNSYNTVGSDNSLEFIKHLRKENPNGTFLELDAISLKTNKKFDAIYSNKVLQHLTNNDLLKSIKRQSEVLNTVGIVCHSFWKGERSEVFKGLFVNYQTKKNLVSSFSSKFEILEISEYQEFEANDSLLIIAKKSK